MTTLLVIGGSGFLGGELCQQGRGRGWSVWATHRWRPIPADLPADVRWLECDILDRAGVDHVVGSARADVVVNAAYRQSGTDAELVCAEGAGNVARSCARFGARLVHVSTDLVFDGKLGRAYTESDTASPVMDYGRAKLRGERLVEAADVNAIIVRTSIIYGDHSAPQEQLVRRAASDPSFAFFVDEWRNPVHVEDLARAILDLAHGGFSGLLHVAGSDRVNRLDFARLLAQNEGMTPGSLTGRGSDPELGPRPADVSLDSSLAYDVLGRTIPGVRERLTQSDSS